MSFARRVSAGIGAVAALLVCVAMVAPVAALAADPGTIEGEVTAFEGGAQLEGVWVCAYLIEDDEYEERCDETGSDGRYALVVAPGEYGVEFWPGNESPYLTQFYDGVAKWSEADPIVLAAGATEDGIDAELLTGATISGEVTVAAGGAPLANVGVCAEPVAGVGPFRCAETDANGEYTIRGIPPGDYAVVFMPYWSGRPDLARQFYDGKSRRQDAEPVSVLVSEDVAGVDAELTVGGRIEGTVRSAATGAPASGTIVCAVDSIGELVECVEANELGRYRIEGLASDDYKMAFSLDFAEWYGEEPSPEEDDGYLTQFYSGSPTLAGATPLALAAPAVLTGIDANLVSLKPTPIPSPPLAAPPAAVAAPIAKGPIAKKCRKGFKKKKVKGKQRCVKVHKGKGKGKKRGNASRRLLVDGGRVRIQP